MGIGDNDGGSGRNGQRVDRSIAMSPPSDTNLPEERMNIQWSADNETILSEWHDIAICYKYMFEKTHAYYANLNAWYTIPAIIFSTISGTASFAQASLPAEYQVYAPMAIGTVNIIIGILTTIQQYLKISELKESNKTVSLAWDKFSRNIAIELAKAPDERQDAGHFLKYSRQEFDRLMENGNTIPSHIVHKFKRKFSGKTPEEKHNYDMIKKPDVCDVLVSINAKRHMWFPKRDEYDTYPRPRGDSVYSGPHPPRVPSGYYYDDDDDEEESRYRRRNTEFPGAAANGTRRVSMASYVHSPPHGGSGTPKQSSKDRSLPSQIPSTPGSAEQPTRGSAEQPTRGSAEQPAHGSDHGSAEQPGLYRLPVGNNRRNMYIQPQPHQPTLPTGAHAQTTRLQSVTDASSTVWSTLQNIFSTTESAAQPPARRAPAPSLNLVPLGGAVGATGTFFSNMVRRTSTAEVPPSPVAPRTATRMEFAARLPPLVPDPDETETPPYHYQAEEGVTVAPRLGMEIDRGVGVRVPDASIIAETLTPIDAPVSDDIPPSSDDISAPVPLNTVIGALEALSRSSSLSVNDNPVDTNTDVEAANAHE